MSTTVYTGSERKTLREIKQIYPDYMIRIADIRDLMGGIGVAMTCDYCSKRINVVLEATSPISNSDRNANPHLNIEKWLDYRVVSFTFG